MERLEIGYVARAHGVRGELRVHLHDPTSETLFDVDRVWIAGKEHAVEHVRPTNNAVLLTVEGVEDKDAADALKGATIEVLRDAVPLDEGEFFLADLPGAEVVDEQGNVLGKVHEIMSGGGQDILVIRDARLERLLPVVPDFIVAFDAAARRLTVAPPEDLPADPIRGK